MQQRFFTKTWVIHMFLTVGRLVCLLLSILPYENSFEASKSDPMVNHEFVSTLEQYLPVAMTTLIFLGVLLDLIVLRRRHFATWIVYYELLLIGLLTLIPYDYGSSRGAVTLFVMVLSFIAFANDPRPQIVAFTACTLVFLQVPPMLVYQREWSLARLFINIGVTFISFATFSVLSMLVIYIV